MISLRKMAGKRVIKDLKSRDVEIFKVNGVYAVREMDTRITDHRGDPMSKCESLGELVRREEERLEELRKNFDF